MTERKENQPMDIELFSDLIKDERGNYYVAVYKEQMELTLVNALVERSYVDILAFNEEFKQKFAEYENHYIGKIVTDQLRHDIVFASKADGHGRMHDLAEVMLRYKVSFIDVIEFYRNPRMGRGERL
ncbi:MULTISPECIES: hypothetical protein [Bacillales]|uniref:hypothetical protein n=1 Tax=Bacillales TaxID=1385 RepID=UPI0006A7CB5E|nr:MULTISPECIES: hypothetical protein [Bacillales]OBZ12662.1 hypothetical protein A7975_16850 [Bacillus sp. FJAT-26390]